MPDITICFSKQFMWTSPQLPCDLTHMNAAECRLPGFQF
ncbi:hypothetical protein J2X15_003211 [Rhodoferax saidenbachensis]|uniref:Uncharacterized protein n=1 Tax=Rhodoferax saidenbachensis TaxID=1484693 RepID=A0ABU1ZTP3_9BURK|nr:hypothetical protein [Rhodoferax saidenbachensis]